MGQVATQPVPSMGCPTLQSGGQIHKCRIKGRGGYRTLVVWGVHEALERETILGVGHKWAWCLHNAIHLRGPQHFRLWDKNQDRPKCGPGGYITPIIGGGGGVLKAFELEMKLEAAHMCAWWLHRRYLLCGPKFFGAGEMRGGGPKRGVVGE